jgi:transposase-like protein
VKEYPIDFDEFTTQFATEEQCRSYLYQLRWPDGFVCPKCREKAGAWRVGALLYTCQKCRHQTSVIAGTIFQDTRKPLRIWFKAIWITTHEVGISALELQQILGIKSYTTAWTWLHKIRQAMVNPNRLKLSGTVEVQDTYIGREEDADANVVIAAEVLEKSTDQLGRVRIEIVPNIHKDTLKVFITENVELGSTVITNGFTPYASIVEIGYNQVILKGFENPKNKRLMPHVHEVASVLESWLRGTYRGDGMPHLQAYLDEFVFRMNRRTSRNRGLLFYRLLENAMRVPPLTQDELLGHKG